MTDLTHKDATNKLPPSKKLNAGAELIVSVCQGAGSPRDLIAEALRTPHSLDAAIASMVDAKTTPLTLPTPEDMY